MELFIRVVNGEAVDHPIMGDNFRDAFPQIDTDNLPPEFARFIRVDRPVIGVYEVYEGVTYELSSDNKTYTDVHHVRSMTDQEKLDKQNQVKTNWATNGFASWVFDEANCRFDPPIPYPTDDKKYIWDEETISWKEFVPPQ